MGKKLGRCNNYDGCAKALQSSPIEADEFNFVCPSCGKPLKLLGKSSPRSGPNWLMLGGLALALAGTAGGVAYLAGHWRETNPSSPQQAPVEETPVPALDNEPDTPLCNPRPLTMEGKPNLYQRVLTLPGAVLAAKPGGGGEELNPLVRFYVYERRQAEGKEWLRVGSNIVPSLKAPPCGPEGWLPADRAVPWKQQITVAFDNPAGRDRVLVFKTVEDLKRIVRSPNPGPELNTLLDAVRARRHDERIVSAEPENYVDFRQRPYVLPIVDFQETANNDGFPIQMLKIHSISTNAASLPPAPAPARLKAAVVFAIDTTKSMRPYIENTRIAVEQIFKRLSASPGGAEIDFGLVVFRSSIKAVPELGYVTKALVQPWDNDNHATFIQALDGLQEAHVSSVKFDEDSYAGVDMALDMLRDARGKDYLSRHLILISDAGPLKSTDELSSRKKSAKDLLEKAKDSPQVRLYAMHLKTAAGLKFNDHPFAEQEYKYLTKNVETGDSLYYPVENAESLKQFSYQINCLPGFISNIIVNLRNKTADPRQIESLCPPVPDDPELNKIGERMRTHASILGEALRMEYLGLSPEGKGVPDDFEGWIAERDLKEPVHPNVDVRILLTKRELNNLSNGVKTILNAAEAGRTSSDMFFNSLFDFATRMGRDPSLAKPKEQINIADMGILGEYLDDLPYRSQVMAMSSDTWASSSASEHEEFILSLKNKLEQYQDYQSDNTLWWPKDAEEDDKLYPVPLDALP